MKKPLIIGIAIIVAVMSIFILAIHTSAAETYDPETDINYIKYIDISLLPSSIGGLTDTQALIKITYEHEYNPSGKNEKLTWYLDGASSSGKAYASIVSYDTNGNATVLIAGTTEGVATIVFHGAYHERGEATTARVVYQVNVEPYETISGIIKTFLASKTVLILVLTICVTVIGKSAIKIFRFGVNYKSSFATVEQQNDFEKSIREEIRTSKSEIQDSILKICLREINRETRPLHDLQSLAANIQTDREILSAKISNMEQKYNDVRKMYENITQLEQIVNRLQYNDGTAEIRRSGK